MATKPGKTAMGQKQDTAMVYYLHVDWNEALWLNRIKMSKIGDVLTEFPNCDKLRMCCQTSIRHEDYEKGCDEAVQWYNPEIKVLRATKDREKITLLFCLLQLPQTSLFARLRASDNCLCLTSPRFARLTNGHVVCTWPTHGQ